MANNILAELENLKISIDDLHAYINDIENILDPVLGPAIPEPDASSERVTTGVLVIDEIAGSISRINYAIYRMRALIGRTALDTEEADIRDKARMLPVVNREKS